jgi:serine/threonine-protein kinase
MELEVLGDRYEMQEPIGRGGMATIYRAVDLRMGRVVAAKILREVYSTDPKFVTRFQREARAASALQHPNIVQVFDYGQSGDNYYIVMEFVDGSDLRRYLKKNGVLSNDRVIQIAHDVALGLGAAHKLGIVHRDVKPQNVMLNDHGLVKLTDFGIASMYKDAEAERLTTTGMTLGTVQYYAPEQAQGEVVSPAADVYALGIVMYEMLTGRTPFDGDTPVTVAMRHIQDLPEPPSAYNPRITPGLERIILRCLEKDPRDRYRDGNALAYALENLGRQGRRGSTVGAGSTRGGPITPSRSQVAQGRGERGSGVARARSAVASEPIGPGGMLRRPSVPSQPTNLRAGFDDDPTYDAAFDANHGSMGGIGTLPNGPVGPTVPRMPGSRPPEWDPPSGPRKPKNRNAPLIAGVIGGAALLLLVGCVLLLFALKPSDSNNTHGTPTATATSATTATTATSPTATAGTVVPQVAVHNEVGKTFTQADLDIQAEGLQFFNVAVVSTQVPGIVIRTSPAGGTTVASGSQVTIYYSAVRPTATATAVVTATATPTCAPTPVTGSGTPTPTPVTGCP